MAKQDLYKLEKGEGRKEVSGDEEKPGYLI